MSWIYRSDTGEFSRNGRVRHVGYSGHGLGKNNPDLEMVPNVGPLPRGRWYGVALIETGHECGPYVIRLAPDPETETYHRGGFLIHGDSKRAPGQGSEGCLCEDLAARMAFWESNDHVIDVVSGNPAESSVGGA